MGGHQQSIIDSSTPNSNKDDGAEWHGAAASAAGLVFTITSSGSAGRRWARWRGVFKRAGAQGHGPVRKVFPPCLLRCGGRGSFSTKGIGGGNLDPPPQLS